MSSAPKRLSLAVALLVLGLSLPLPAAARSSRLHSKNPTEVSQQEPGFLRALWNALASIWGNDGSSIDPFG